MEKLGRKIYIAAWFDEGYYHKIFYTRKEADEFSTSKEEYVLVWEETFYFDIPDVAVCAMQERANDLLEDVKRIEQERDELLDFLGGRIQKTEPEHKEESLPW